jgi:hypothetical protein
MPPTIEEPTAQRATGISTLQQLVFEAVASCALPVFPILRVEMAEEAYGERCWREYSGQDAEKQSCLGPR